MHESDAALRKVVDIELIDADGDGRDGAQSWRMG